MRKCLTVLCVSFLFVSTTIAQPGDPLIIRGYGKDIHLDHKVAAKEGIFSIGRLYNVHPKTIAAYNNLDLAKGLTLGQVVHIPLTDTNFSQKSDKGTPIYYSVGEKETLQKVSNVNNKVALQSLRSWNKLMDDNLKAGKKLIIGFLVTNESAVATLPPQEKKEISAKEITDKLPVVTTNKKEDKPALKSEPKKEEPQKTEPKKEELKKNEPVTKPLVTADMTGQGYFKSSFDQQVKTNPVSKTETVTSGIFRMVSGPQEARFYMLADGVPSGTIVRVINPDNNKAVYAKVLGEMGGVRQKQGLNILISNAAASTLGITDTDKFIVKINY
jgi:hypothetical protein